MERPGALSGAEEGLDDLLRAARPAGAAAQSLERRLAVASIVAASGATQTRQRLGRLEVQARIGGGAMGVVYRAYDPELQRAVAVKLLRSWTEQEERQQIVEEARRLAQISHPNVVAVHDIVNDDDGLYFTMEYVPGMTLRAWLDSRPSADYREVLELFVQAGRGLAAAHASGMVHRDFKPDNVLVGADGRVRVVDFGLAHVVHDRLGPELAGTPYYMAPETREGAPATPLSDQYSFCVALRDALGEREVPAQVRAAVQEGLSEAPEDRHPSLEVLVELLARALTGGDDDRSRSLLLDRVDRIWLRGVLERAAGERGLAELGLHQASSLVSPPWRDWEGGLEPRGSAVPPPAGGESPRSRDLAELLRQANGSLLLVGPPGAGKTTLLLQLCRELWRSALLNPDAPAPAVLSLSTFRPDRRERGAALAERFHRWVADELVIKYGLPRPSVGRWFDDAGIVLLLDGLDETDSTLRDCVVETLNRFRERYPLTMVVTCRDAEYEALPERLAFGAAYRVLPLDDEGMAMVLEDRRADRLSEQLEADPSLRSGLRNPLLLSLYASGSEDATLPGGPVLERAYAHYVHAALQRVPQSERARLREQLAYLAAAMQRRNTSDLWLERLDFGWLPRAWERYLGYALGVSLLGLLSLGLNYLPVALFHAKLDTAIVFGFSVWVFSFLYTRGRIVPVESLRWSARRALRLLPITLGCATLVGLIEGLSGNFASNMIGAAFTGSTLGILFALEPADRAVKVKPNAGIGQSLRNALTLSLASGVPVGLFVGFVLQPFVLRPLSISRDYETVTSYWVAGTSIGLFVLIAMFLIYGGFSAVMHYTLRLWLAVRSPLPLNLTSVLDRAADLGLMRRVGGGYVFLHRTLLDHFAARARESDSAEPPRAARRSPSHDVPGGSVPPPGHVPV